MKTISIIICTLAVSAIAAAATPDLRELGAADDHHKQMAECMQEGWAATHPTDAQNQSLATLMTTLHNTVAANKDAIETAAREFFLTWGHHPIDGNAVHQAQYTLDNTIAPVKTAVIDTMVSAINLLTIEQRDLYDHAFAVCMNSPAPAPGPVPTPTPNP